MARKIIQICTNMDPNYGFGITALCDDGSVWDLDHPYSIQKKWVRILDIPQPEDEQGAEELS